MDILAVLDEIERRLNLAAIEIDHGRWAAIEAELTD